jgi:hypothetical protein
MGKVVIATNLFLVVLFLCVPGILLAQCSTGIENSDATPPMVFGNFTEGYRTDRAQSFVLDCDAHLQLVRSRFYIHVVNNGETLPLAEGDTIQCDILDSSRNSIIREYHVMESGTGYQTIDFDFSSHEFKIAAGDYYFNMSLPQERWAYVSAGTAYADGVGYFVTDGVWVESTDDLRFTLEWDDGSLFLDTDEMDWGGVKAYYR